MTDNIVQFNRKENDASQSTLNLVWELTETGRFAECLDVLEGAVNDGEEEAFYWIGQFYEKLDRKNPYTDPEKAVFYYEKSIEVTGSAEAYLDLALLYLSGRLGKADYERANEICTTLLDNDIDDCGFVYWLLARSNFYGLGIEKDLDEAHRLGMLGWSKRHIPSLGIAANSLVRKGEYIKGVFHGLRAIVLTLYYLTFDKSNPKIKILLGE